MDLSKLKIYDSKDFPSYLPKLNQLYDDLFSGGKGFRSKLIKKVGEAISLDSKSIHLLGQTIEFIHNASLLHDDLIDRSHLRRGKTTAWLRFTPEYAVLAGDYLLARVMVNLSKYGNINLIQYTAEMISDLLEGEWIQDSLVGDFEIGKDQLDRVHELKTASLFKWCLRAPHIAKEDYRKELHNPLEQMGSILGILFQRSDDLLDFDIRNGENKAVLGDLKSGYLNSFGVYLFKGLDAETRAKAIKSESLGQLINTIGQDHFDTRVASFDEKNEELIQFYEHQLSLVESALDAESQSLVGELKPLSDLLYWRNQKP